MYSTTHYYTTADPLRRGSWENSYSATVVATKPLVLESPNAEGDCLGPDQDLQATRG